MTIKEHLDKIPPWAYRLIAKTRVDGKKFRALDLPEIATRSGLPRITIERLSAMTEWTPQSLCHADAFITACGYDPFHQQRAIEQLKRMASAKNGVAGIRQLRMTKSMPNWERAARSRQLQRLEKILAK